MNYRTPLGRAKGLGAAGEGSVHWWRQRISALLLIIPELWLTVVAIRLPQLGHAEVLAWIKVPCNAFLLIAFFVPAFYHAMLGLQVVIEDYVHDRGLKLVVTLVSKLLCSALALAAVLVVLRISFMN